MKRRNQNNFMPFTSNASAIMNHFSGKRKSSLVAAFSNKNQGVEEVNFERSISTQNTDTEFYTSFDMDLENAVFTKETRSDEQFIFDATVINCTNPTNREHFSNEKFPIISLHWPELSDHDLSFAQEPENGKEAVVKDKIQADAGNTFQPYFWFV